MIATVAVIIPMMIFAPSMVAFFNQKPEVIRYGSLLLRWISLFYVFCCINQVYSAVLRGAGNSKTPMIIMLCSFVLFRQCYLFIMANYVSNTLVPIALSYPAGWIVCSVFTVLYYRHNALSRSQFVAG